MFINRRQMEQNPQEIVWEKETIAVLSISEQEERIEKLEIQMEDTVVLVRAAGVMKTQEPSFGTQKYYNGKKGICYQLKIPEFTKGVAIYQHKDWWVRPAFINSQEKVPEKTQLLLIKEKEFYFALLAVCGDECRTDISGTADGLQITVASNAGNRKKISELSLAIAGGTNPYQCCENAVKSALRCLGRENMLRTNRKYPEVFRYFGWCSWDAFYKEVSSEGILEKMEEFKAKEIPLRWVLIDDGWMNADYVAFTLKDFEADEKKFPGGLRNCTEKIKKDYHVSWVGVWHAVMGYWNGIQQNSPAANMLQDYSFTLPDGRILPAPDAGKAFGFYSRWHEYLQKQCGIDFVKVDGQSSISTDYGGIETYGNASGQIQKGLNAAAALYFDNAIINCMGMASEDMWNRPSSAVTRSSDDFVPDQKNGFREHVIQNGFNSLLQGQFFWGDWDMFFSRHPESKQNAILRAVSGGPVYVSDKVGETEPSVVFPLIKQNGEILRCDGVGMPAMDCLFENPLSSRKPLKIFNSYQENQVLAAFGIQDSQEDTEGVIQISDIPCLAGRQWVVYEHESGICSKLSAGKSVNFQMKADDARLFLILPCENAIIPVGILEKYISFGCFETVYEYPDVMMVRVDEPGTFCFFAKYENCEIQINKKVLSKEEWQCTVVEHEKELFLYTLTVNSPNSLVKIKIV